MTIASISFDPIAEPFEDVEIAVDDRVEERVEAETGGRELAFAEAALDDGQGRERALVHRHDRVVLHEDPQLAMADQRRGSALEGVDDEK